MSPAMSPDMSLAMSCNVAACRLMSLKARPVELGFTPQAVVSDMDRHALGVAGHVASDIARHRGMSSVTFLVSRPTCRQRHRATLKHVASEIHQETLNLSLTPTHR